MHNTAMYIDLRFNLPPRRRFLFRSGATDMPTVTARGAPKVVIVLDAASVAQLLCPEGAAPCVALSIQCPSRFMHCEVASEAVRKAQAEIREHGSEGVVVMIQGCLGAGDTITEAGLVCQPKVVRKPEPIEAA